MQPISAAKAGDFMAWVAVYQQVRDHPKLRDLCRKLNISRQEALGLLVFIWLWGLNNTDRSGKILSATVDDIAEAAYWRKDPKVLYAALIECRWIDEKDGAVYIHDWDEFNKPYFDYIDRKEKDKLRKRTRNSDGNSVEIPPETPQEFHVLQYQTIPNQTIPIKDKSSKDDSLPEGNGQCPYQEVINLFNQICKSLPTVQKLTESRKKKLLARWKEMPYIEQWKQLFKEIGRSPFLNGDNAREWKASFDWLIENDRNYQKVLEGQYNGKQKQADKFKDVVM